MTAVLLGTLGITEPLGNASARFMVVTDERWRTNQLWQ